MSASRFRFWILPLHDISGLIQWRTRWSLTWKVVIHLQTSQAPQRLNLQSCQVYFWAKTLELQIYHERQPFPECLQCDKAQSCQLNAHTLAYETKVCTSWSEEPILHHRAIHSDSISWISVLHTVYQEMKNVFLNRCYYYYLGLSIQSCCLMVLSSIQVSEPRGYLTSIATQSLTCSLLSYWLCHCQSFFWAPLHYWGECSPDLSVCLHSVFAKSP